MQRWADVRDTLHGFRSHDDDDDNNKHITQMWVHLQLVHKIPPQYHRFTKQQRTRRLRSFLQVFHCSNHVYCFGEKLNTGAAAREFETVEGTQASSTVLVFFRCTLIHYSCLKSDVYLLPLPLLCHPLHHAGNRQTLPPTPAAH